MMMRQAMREMRRLFLSRRNRERAPQGDSSERGGDFAGPKAEPTSGAIAGFASAGTNYSRTGLRFPRFISVAGKIYLRIQVDGDDRQVEISIKQAFNLLLDLLSFVAIISHGSAPEK